MCSCLDASFILALVGRQRDDLLHKARYMSRVTQDLSRGSPTAASAIWPDAVFAEPIEPSVKKRAALRALILASAAALLFYFSWRVPACVSAAFAIATLMLGIFAPAYFRTFEGLLDRASTAVGVALSWLFLSPFYFLVLTPLAWLTRKQRVQKMSLTFRKNQGSNWRTRERAPANLDRPY